MRPAFLEELLKESNLRKIWWGVPTGYLLTVTLVLFGVFFDHFDLLPNAEVLIFYLAPFKFLTNTWMWWALRRKRWVLEFAGLNQLADVVLLTAVVYFTGGPASPLTSLYFVVLAVVAMLTNAGVTITTALLMVVSYTVMLILVSAGSLEIHPPFLQTIYESGPRISWELVVLDAMKLLVLMAIMVASMTTVLRMLSNRERELAAKNEELRRADQLKTEFIANVTHELRTPIHGLMGLSEMLTEDIYGKSNEKQKGAYENIRLSAQTLLSMVDDLLAMQKTPGWITEPVPVEVVALVAEVSESATWMLGTQDVEVRYEPCSEKVWVETDRSHLRHILTNLVANAIKFTPEEKAVHLIVEACDGARITIRDEGIGIPPEELESIFEPFYQVDGSSSRRYGGAGLGLSVVSSLCRRLGIGLELESIEGEGTTFVLSIPAKFELQAAGS